MTNTEQDLIMQVRHVLPSAIKCFFHVYEELFGTYGFRVQRHVLVYPGAHVPATKTGCDRDLDSHAYVAVGNDVVVDRSWCRSCAAIVDSEARRGHTPSSTSRGA